MKHISTILVASLLFFSCSKDRNITPPVNTPPSLGSRVLIDYWNFNNTTSLATLIAPTDSTNHPSISFDFATVGSTTGYYDSVTSTVGTINTQHGDTAGNALRVRNPSTDMILTIPTTNYKDILLSYAVEASSVSNGALTDSVYYTTDGTTYTNAQLPTVSYMLNAYIDPNYVLETFDFSSITAANNNPNFKVKISFANGNHNTSGNDRFDNITVFADSLNAAGTNPPVISSAAIASDTVSQAFSYTIAASATPTAYALTGNIPAGISINTTTGVISGTPTTVGVYIDTLKATNTYGTGTKVLTITILPVNNKPVISSLGTATDSVGGVFSYTIIASHTPTSYRLTGNVPAGISINTSTGVISGTITATAGTYIDTLKALNATDTGTKVFTITITSATTLLLDYWNFNNTASLSTLIAPTSTINGGTLSFDFTTVASTTGYYDSVSDTVHVLVNQQNGDPAGNALRVRNPCLDMVIALPTTNYKNIVLNFGAEASSASKAALIDSVYYTTDGTTYINSGISPLAFSLSGYYDNPGTNSYAFETYDFSSIPAVNNNPDFKVKIVFTSGNLNTSGNDRFDNITLQGDHQ
jgi:putative Ig domain-containing protein